MGIVLWIIVGAIAGWIAHIIVIDESPSLNVLVGIVGALIAGFLLTKFQLFDAVTLNTRELSVSGVGVSLIGSFILLVIVNLLRYGGSTH